MNQSRGRLYFHRLFSLEELGFRDPEPFLAPLIREFLKIGEAVAGRWIEMPQAVLLFQMVFGQPDSGAIYLYDRRLRVFYMLGFDGPDDHLTLEEFEQLSEEYNLIRFAEQPALIEQQPCLSHFPNPSCLLSCNGSHCRLLLTRVNVSRSSWESGGQQNPTSSKFGARPQAPPEPGQGRFARVSEAR